MVCWNSIRTRNLITYTNFEDLNVYKSKIEVLETCYGQIMDIEVCLQRKKKGNDMTQGVLHCDLVI